MHMHHARRSYGTPPAMVMNVMSSVCLLLKEPTDWISIKHIIADPVAFLKRLTSLDKDKVSDKVIRASNLIGLIRRWTKLSISANIMS